MKKISYQYKPIFVKPNDTEILNELKEDRSINIIDTIDSQLKELIKSKYPSKQISKEEFPHLIHEFINQTSIENYGTWVYYPWSKKLIHILNEKEFVHLRTNRNMHKISPEEMDVLATKKIGIIGLSVGHSIALTIATERICKEIRLADFDTLELSNLNRIRTGIHNLGLPKVVIAAREIAEIDPYIHLT